jgi:cyclohexanone monooxygenase
MSSTSPEHDVTRPAADARELDVVVIGAGFAGLYAMYKLRGLGFNAHGYERGSGVGGAWYWNRYPGCRCDVESLQYSYAYLPEFEQEWQMQTRFPAQPDILRYLQAAADHMDVVKDFTFNTAITRLNFDEEAGRWDVYTEAGLIARARFVLTAVGALSAANHPNLPRLESFKGDVYFTGSWPHEPVDFTGKRVAVIGTGSSGIQVIPELAKQAGHLTVLQRTAQWATPANNRPLDPGFEQMWKQNYQEWRRKGRESESGLANPFSMRSALDVSDEERERVFEEGWRFGGPDFFVGTFGDITTNEEANKTAQDFVRRKINEIVKDPETARKLTPHYLLGAKRPVMDSGYWETFNRPNVSLADLREAPITGFTENGVLLAGELLELDAIVLATGYDAVTGALTALDIHGRDGHRLAEDWADGWETFLGLAIPGYPNLFTITGPGSTVVTVMMTVCIEQNVNWIIDCFAYLRAHGIERIEADDTAAREWTQYVQEVGKTSIFSKVPNWFSGANVPGKPVQFLPFAGGFSAY